MQRRTWMASITSAVGLLFASKTQAKEQTNGLKTIKFLCGEHIIANADELFEGVEVVDFAMSTMPSSIKMQETIAYLPRDRAIVVDRAPYLDPNDEYSLGMTGVRYWGAGHPARNHDRYLCYGPVKLIRYKDHEINIYGINGRSTLEKYEFGCMGIPMV